MHSMFNISVITSNAWGLHQSPPYFGHSFINIDPSTYCKLHIYAFYSFCFFAVNYVFVFFKVRIDPVRELQVERINSSMLGVSWKIPQNLEQPEADRVEYKVQWRRSRSPSSNTKVRNLSQVNTQLHLD